MSCTWALGWVLGLGAGPIDFVNYKPQGTNVTDRYFELMKDPPNISAQLKNYKIIF